MKIFGKKDQTSLKKPLKPPEAQFFDPPDGSRPKSSLGSLFQKRSVRLVLVGMVVVFLATLVFSPRKEKKRIRPEAIQDEKRALVSEAAIERALDGSSGGKKTQVRGAETARPEKKKRRYDTGIAVFVKQPQENEAPVRQRERREEVRLGLPSGTKIPALLEDRVFSFNVEAPVIALVSKDFFFQDKLVIPKNSEFLGEAQVLKSVDRINVRFERLIFPDGREVRVRALALSEDGSAGIRGRVDKHTDRRVLKAVGETLLAGTSLFVGGSRSDPYSLEDQMRSNLAQNLTNEAARDLRATRIEKSVTVEAYTPIQVMLLEAV